MLLELPYEILTTEIFPRLDVKSLIRMSSTCKTAYQIILDEPLWKSLSIYNLYKPEDMSWKEYVKYINYHDVPTMTHEKYFISKFSSFNLDIMIYEEIVPQINNDHFFMAFLYNYKPLVLVEYIKGKNFMKYYIQESINLTNRIIILNYNRIIKYMIDNTLYDMLEMYIIQWFQLVQYIIGRAKNNKVTIHIARKRYKLIEGFKKDELLNILNELKYNITPSKRATKSYLGVIITSILIENNLLLPEIDYSELRSRCNLQYIYLREHNGFMTYNNSNNYWFSPDSYKQDMDRDTTERYEYNVHMTNYNIHRNHYQINNYTSYRSLNHRTNLNIREENISGRLIEPQVIKNLESLKCSETTMNVIPQDKVDGELVGVDNKIPFRSQIYIFTEECVFYYILVPVIDYILVPVIDYIFVPK